MRSKKFLLLAIPVALLFAACEKTTKLMDENVKTIPVDTTKTGFVKFIHAYAPLTPTIISGAAGVHVYMENIRLTGSGTTGVIYNGTHPAVTGSYANLPTGNHTFYYIQNRITASVFAPIAGDTVMKNTANIDAGKYYTMFMADSVQKPGVYTVPDNYTIPAIGKYQVRFANLIYNPNDRYDVFADSIGVMVATNIGYREITNFIEVAVPKSSENFTVRKTATPTVIYSVSITPVSQRVYTLYTRGLNGAVGRTPGITFYTNR